MSSPTVTLTVPYEGRDRTISGSSIAIAKALVLIEAGLPTLAEQGVTLSEADDRDGGPASPAMASLGTVTPSHFVRGSHTLVSALLHAMRTGRASGLRRSIILDKIDD